ncbi:MAG TPA: polysaccharide deacetylase family protein [Solirubrobacteraceae bacterium]
MADVILAYHSIDEQRTRLSVSPAAFERQMHGLARRGFRAITVSELVSDQPTGAPRVAITFDDGFASVRERALPLLEHLGFRATVFAIAGALGRVATWTDAGGPLPPLELMKPDELTQLAGAGWEIASHTCTHRCSLDLSSAQWAEELSRSREILTALRGAPVRGFAYPHGCYDARAAAAVSAAGYAWACTTMPGTLAGSPELFGLRRVTVGRTTTPIRFRVASYEPIQALRRRSRAHRLIASGQHAHGPGTETASFA